MAYATVAQLRGYLQQVGTTPADVTLMGEVLERATSIVDAELGFSFDGYQARAARDVWAGNGGQYLYLPAHEAGSLVTVHHVQGRGLVTETLRAVTDYVIERGWKLYRLAGWQRREWYRAVAAWGVGQAPASIVEVTLEVAVNIWQGRQATRFSENLGAEGGAQMFYRALSWSQRSIIQREKQRFERALP
jgi:hypothetical protein